MKNSSKKTLKNTTFALAILSPLAINLIQSEAVSLPGSKIIENSVSRNGTVMTYQFSPNYGSSQYNAYGNALMYREVYMPENENYYGGFVWYSIVPQKNPTLAQTDLGRMLENRQTAVGSGGNYLVSGAGKNLKYGAVDPWDMQYYGNNTGTKTIKYGAYKGKKYEYRFTGYNLLGNAVGNPYFPPDSQSSRLAQATTRALNAEYWTSRNYVLDSWKLQKSINMFGSADALNEYSRKVQWIEQYLFRDYPQFRQAGDAHYWANRVRPLTNPSTETGVWVAFHRLNGIIWYTQFVTTPPEQPNLRIVSYKVYDKNNNLMAEMRRNGTYNKNTAKTYTYNNKKLAKGETYRIVVGVKNMTEKVQNISDVNMNLNHMYQYDSSIGLANEFSTPIITKRAKEPYNDKLPSGKIAEFEYNYTVPTATNPSAKINLMADIPDTYYNLGYNTLTMDDDANLEMEISSENLKVEFTEFYNEEKILTQTVTPGEEMWVKYKVTKTDGNRPVALADLQINLTDKQSVTTNNVYTLDEAKKKDMRTPITDGVLREPGDYAIVWASVTPQQPKICTQGSIPSKWKAQGLNSIASDDVTPEVCLTNSDNIIITNFTATPGTIITEDSSKSTAYRVDFDLSNNVTGNSTQTKKVPLVYTANGRVIKTEEVLISPNKTISLSRVLPPVTVREGTPVILQVEANPAPRKYTEILVDQRGRVVPPYEDNTGFDKVHVVKVDKALYCDVSNVRNDWSTTFTLDYWFPYTYSHGDHSHTVTRWRTEYETVRFNEQHEITEIFFKSKETDNLWVEIDGNDKAEVNAGSEFDLKVVTKYSTDTFDKTPRPYDNGASGRLVSPSYTPVDSETALHITFPFVDESGEQISVSLKGNQEGHWSDTVTTYTLSDLKGENMLVNKETKNGTHSVRISTQQFDGSADKPSTAMLCDVVFVDFEVKASHLDDVKTHIIQ